MRRTRSLISAVVLMIAWAGRASAGNYYVDIVVCESPPAAIEWTMLYMQVNVWERGDYRNRDINHINPSLGGNVYESNHTLRGSPTVWHASVSERFELRVYGYDGKYYLITWGPEASYNNGSVSNITTIHVDFTWKLDPVQN